jgi:hypothetical protein
VRSLAYDVIDVANSVVIFFVAIARTGVLFFFWVSILVMKFDSTSLAIDVRNDASAA